MPIAIGLGVGAVVILICACACFYCCVTNDPLSTTRLPRVTNHDQDVNQLTRVESTGQLHLGTEEGRQRHLRPQGSRRASSQGSDKRRSSFRLGTQMCGITIHNQWTGRLTENVSKQDSGSEVDQTVQGGSNNTTHI